MNFMALVVSTLGLVLDVIMAPHVTIPFWRAFSNQFLHEGMAAADPTWANSIAIVLGDAMLLAIFVVVPGFVVASGVVGGIRSAFR